MMTTTMSETYTPPIIPRMMANVMKDGKLGVKGRMLAQIPVKTRHTHMMLLRFIKPGQKNIGLESESDDNNYELKRCMGQAGI